MKAVSDLIVYTQKHFFLKGGQEHSIAELRIHPDYQVVQELQYCTVYISHFLSVCPESSLSF